MSEIDRLDIQVQTQAQKANKDLDRLASQLEKVGTSLLAVNTSGLSQFGAGIDRLASSVKNMSSVKTTDFTRTAKNIEKLGAIDHSGIRNTANALKEISASLTASTNLSSGSAHIVEFTKGLSKLGNKSVSNAIANIPLMANALKELMKTLSTAPQVSQNLINMTNALGNLASQGSKVTTATKSINNAISKNSSVTKQVSANAKALTFSFTALIAKVYVLRKAFTSAFSSIEKSMDFTETLNLFQTSFKKVGMDAAVKSGLEWGSVAAEQFAVGFIDEAQGFTDKVSGALSVDPNSLMNYQAIFAQMSNAFGVASESTMDLSQSFTMLGLDMASLFNTDIEGAMKKLQSGLAGQTEPLRAWGVDITEATLKLTAMKYGIEDTVTKMSQAAKTQLRYLAIMDQTEVAFGDMAKTIDSPANQLRVLQQQWELLTRSIGNVFLPVASALLPYINGIVIALRRMIDTLATAVGFELPSYIDSEMYVDVTDGVADIGGTADDATESVKKLNKSLASIDEINVLSEGKTSTSNPKIDSGAGYGLLDDAINQKTESYMKKFNDELAKMQKKSEEFADKVTPKIQGFIDVFDKISPIIEGIAVAFITYKVVTWFGDLAASLGALNPTAGVAFLAVGAIVAIYSAVKKYNKKLKEEDLAKRFGDIELSLEDVKKIADELTKNDYTANIDIYVTENQKLDEIESAIQTDIETLNKLNWKVSVGLALTEGEVEQYKTTIESFIANSEAYIEQQHYVTTLAINAVVQDDNFNAELTALINEYYNTSKGQLAELGKNLRSEMDNALADGVLDATERQVIDNLVKEINEVTESIADAEFKAKLNAITVEGDISADSFKDVTKEVQGLIDERVKKAEEAQYQLLFALEAKYQLDMKNATTQAQKDKIQADYEKNVKKINGELGKTKSTIIVSGTEFSLDVLNTNYSKELTKVKPDLEKTTTELLEPAIANEIENLDTVSAMGVLAGAMVTNYTTAFSQSGMTGAAKAGLNEMLEALEPSSEQIQKIYEDALKSGEAIPSGISAALTDEMTLKALGGDVDAISYLVGQKLSTDEKYLELLETAELSAQGVNKNFINGLKSGIPDLEIQSGKIVTKSRQAIRDKSKESKDTIAGYSTKNIIAPFANTFKNDTTLSEAAKGWLNALDKIIENHKLPTMTQMIDVKLDTAGISNTGLDVMDLNLSKYVKGYATGGFPNTGEMFMARENGITEMVGKWGNKTAVANNGQITDGIASAVESAMANVLLPALSMVGGGGNVTVENKWIVDSEEMYRMSQKGKAKSERRYQTTTLLK